MPAENPTYTHYGRSTYIAWEQTTFDLLEIDSGGTTATTEQIEVTHYGSTIRNFIPGYTDYGSIALTVSTERTPDVFNIRKSFEDRVIGNLSIVTPMGLQITYKGFITSFSEIFDKHGLYTIKLVFKFTNKPVTTAYTEYKIIPLSQSNLYCGCSYGLYLSAGGKAQSGGEGAIYSLDTIVTSNYTRIHDGNTLTIGTDEQQTKIVVRAIIKPEEEIVTSITATYNIVHPDPSSIEISGAENIEHSKQAGVPKNVPYTATVYPNGSQQTCSWKVFDSKTGGAPKNNAVIIDAGSGILTIDANYHQIYTDQIRNFGVYAESTVASGIGSLYMITIKIV